MTPVERVALSIRDRLRARGILVDDDAGMETCRDLARAAIAALREPTAAMIRAGYACQWRGEHAASAPGTMADQYRAMIDAALEESP